MDRPCAEDRASGVLLNRIIRDGTKSARIGCRQGPCSRCQIGRSRTLACSPDRRSPAWCGPAIDQRAATSEPTLSVPSRYSPTRAHGTAPHLASPPVDAEYQRKMGRPRDGSSIADLRLCRRPKTGHRPRESRTACSLIWSAGADRTAASPHISAPPSDFRESVRQNRMGNRTAKRDKSKA